MSKKCENPQMVLESDLKIIIKYNDYLGILMHCIKTKKMIKRKVMIAGIKLLEVQ